MTNSRNRDFDKYAIVALLISSIFLFTVFREALALPLAPAESFSGRDWGFTTAILGVIVASSWQLRDRSIIWSVPTWALVIACMWSGVSLLILRGLHHPSALVVILGFAYTVIGIVLSYPLRNFDNYFLRAH
jgi:hypothetical protein